MELLIKDVKIVQLSGDVTKCSVYISNDEIVSVTDSPVGFVPEKTIDGTGKLLIPGFVNAHTHVSMTLFRNCADDLLFDDWLFGRIMPLEDKLTADDCYWGMMLGVMEMIKTGTTSFVDMYYFLDALVKAAQETGIRTVLSRGLAGDKGDPTAEGKLKEALDAVERYKGYDNISFMLAPHAPYTCDEGFMGEIAAEARRIGIPINTHLCESLGEIETIRARYGKTPIELADSLGLLTDTSLAAHCVHLTDGDIEILAQRGSTVVTNPVSNLKLANGVAPVPKLLKAGVKVALGTDSAASNNTLNMFGELNMLSLIHKGINGDAQAVTAREGFRIATKNGALAIGRPDLGEIAAGMKADLVLLSLEKPNMKPENDLVSALAYSANGSEVETVIVDGKILLENGEFLTIDTDRVYYETAKICERIGV